MWPGRRYWAWSVVVWLSLTWALYAYVTWGPFFGRGPLYSTALGVWLVFWTPMFVLVAFIVGLAVRARRGESRSGGDWRWFALWVVSGLVTAAAAVEVGPVVLLAALALAGWLIYRHGMQRSLYGAIGGLGSLLILSMVWEAERTPIGCQPVAHEPNVASCTSHAGFVLPTALGVLLLVCAIVAQRRRRPA